MDSVAENPVDTEEHIESVSTAGTLRRASETLLSVLHNRLELATLELKEEKYWAVATVMIAVFAASFAVLSLVAVLVTVALLIPAEARPWVMIGISAVMVGGFFFTAITLKNRLNRPPVLAETLAELKKDIACFKGQD